jgi:hypothetical protein
MDKKDKQLVNVIQNAKHILNVMDNVNSIIIEDSADNIKIEVKREEKCLNK